MPWYSQASTGPSVTKAFKVNTNMAKSEIPSIIVHNGGESGKNYNNMDQHTSCRPSRLEKQEEFEMEEESYVPSPVTIQIEDRGGNHSALDDSTNERRILEAGSNGNIERERPVETSDFLPNGAKVDGGPEEAKPDKSSRSSGHRLKVLVRSHAVHDDTSPPPDLETVITNTNMLSVTSASSFMTQSQSKGSSSKNRLGRQGGSQGSQGSTESSSGLSRDSSTETYTDSTGIDLQQFIIDTLHKNQKDRMMLLKIEQDLITLIKDNKRQSQKFGQMSSYNRMLVHRVAAFFGLDHYVDQNGTSVIVNKTKNTRIPDARFQEYIRDELLPEEPKKSILKRDSISFEEGKEKSPERQSSTDSRRSKSFEEREEEYEKARARIFNLDEGFGDSPLSRSQEGIHTSSRRSSQEDVRWPSSDAKPWSSTDSDSSGRPHGAKAGNSFEIEGTVHSGAKNGHAVAMLSKAESDSKEVLVKSRMSRPAVTKASSFGGISVLSRDVSTGKTPTPKITKAESFNVSTISSSHNAASIDVPGSSQISTVSSSSPTSLVSSSSSVQSSTTSQFTAAVGTVQQTFPMVAGRPMQLHVPVQQISSQQIPGWQQMNRDSNADYTGHSIINQQPVVWPLSTSGDVVFPGGVIVNQQAGAPFVNVDNVLFRYKSPSNLGGHTIMLAPFQPLSMPPPNQVPISNHVSAGSAVSPPTQPQPSHQTQQPPVQLHLPHPQQTMHITPPPAVLYIPYVPSQIQQPTLDSCTNMQSVQQPTQSAQQSAQLLNDQRQFAVPDPSSTSIDELVAQMSSLSLVPTQLPVSQPQENSASGRGILSIDPNPPPQNYFIPAFKSQGIVNQQGNITQLPVYYMQQIQQASNIHPVRYVFPASSPVQQSAQGTNSSINIGGQVAADIPGHIITQTNPQATGPQYLPGYPLLALSNSGDTSASSSFVSYTLATQASAAVTTTTSVLVPSSPVSLPVYPYGNMVIGNLNNNNSSSNSQSSYTPSTTATQPSAQPSAYVQTPLAVQTPAALPMYIVTTSSTQTPVVAQAQVAGNVAAQLGLYRSQSLPSAATSASGTVLNQHLSGNSSLVGYTLYAPPSHVQSAVAQQTPQTPVAQNINQSSHIAQASQFTPTFLTTFQVYRPNIPVVGNIRTGTPSPPQNMIPQYQPSSSTNKVPLNFPLVKQASDPGLECFSVGNVGNGRTEQLKCNRSSQFQTATSVPCGPAGGLVYRRSVPMMQDLCFIGHPLQQHLNPLMLPQQRSLQRYPHPSINNPSSSRPPKTRKQRNKGGTSASNSGGGGGGCGGGSGSSRSGTLSATSQSLPDITGNHILEIEGLPEGMKRSEVERYLEQVTCHGAKIQFLNTENNGRPANGSDFVVSARHLVLAVFESDTAAQSALLGIKTPKFQLRQLRHGSKDEKKHS